MTEKQKISIKIDPELWKEAKIKAIERDMAIDQFVEELLRKEVGG